MIHAIRTQYRGHWFRSRLEATWAAFFDGVAWQWAYEPVDLGGYIPDFVLMWPHGPLLVEVKPAFSLAALEGYAARIEDSGWTGEACLVGAGPVVDIHEGSYEARCLGLLSQRLTPDGQDEAWCWDRGHLIHCPECRHYGIYHPTQSWYCYRCGGGHKVYASDLPEPLKELWGHAQSITQYRPRP